MKHPSDVMPKFPIGDSNKKEVLNVVAHETPDLYKVGISLTEPTFNIEFQVPTSSLGTLDVLPLELFDLVLRCSDMRTLSTLRYINRRTRLVVDASLPYKHIISSAPHIRATFERTGVASHFSVQQVFSVLTRPACSICGKFGMYLWIPECIRCCFTCLREAQETMPMTERDAQVAFGLHKNQKSKIPVMVTLPGSYTLFQKLRRRQVRLVSRKLAKQLGVVVHGGEDGLATYLSSSNSKAKAAYDQRCAADNRPIAYDSFGRINNTVDNMHRYISAVHFPYFDRASHTTHLGLACHGCQVALERGLEDDLPSLDDDALIRLRDQTYTEQGILDHLDECEDAQGLWLAFNKKRKFTRK
ncbi:hypothetical protein CPB84DRAFT_1843605 [Gymnopilus junonius]|uniref:F-box domain-containing protein n=1 Tax=Gymnopilus junonius TaxID=109634 RepID=A0A9P5NX13_GYMJU|nr:hypothetical protein CPB84DRAFT_1843605 [Gymnopilus junonius]